MAKPPRGRPAAQPPLGRPTLTPNVESLIVGYTRPRTPAAPAGLTESVTPEVPDSVSQEVPRYLTMVRKEARVRADQADALAVLRRRLSRTRTERSETLTGNSLIRVASCCSRTPTGCTATPRTNSGSLSFGGYRIRASAGRGVEGNGRLGA
jgi:hypothetical protein